MDSRETYRATAFQREFLVQHVWFDYVFRIGFVDAPHDTALLFHGDEAISAPKTLDNSEDSQEISIWKYGSEMISFMLMIAYCRIDSKRKAENSPRNVQDHSLIAFEEGTKSELRAMTRSIAKRVV